MVYTWVRGIYSIVKMCQQKNLYYGALNLDLLCYKCNEEIDVPATEDGIFFDQQDGAYDQQEVLQDQGKHQVKY
jgi:hypothetical protein